MQPQCAAHIAATSPGDVPLAGMAELYIEVAPGNEVFRAADIALKAAGVRPALQIIEREFGLLEIHSEQQAEVLASGQAVLDELGHDRGRPDQAGDRLHPVHHQRAPVPGAAAQQVAQGLHADARARACS